ncbi:unnamed protein product [Protopolystoma xenopodis]|uniref:Uncharacterized protein n=1 Tax=Protopolystoma xenopodis TaxID=117903 RepID=A0A3S5BZV7_9PLAT|nr:unnamed protein product [Protopolystoma xenopodis]
MAGSGQPVYGLCEAASSAASGTEAGGAATWSAEPTFWLPALRPATRGPRLESPTLSGPATRTRPRPLRPPLQPSPQPQPQPQPQPPASSGVGLARLASESGLSRADSSYWLVSPPFRQADALSLHVEVHFSMRRCPRLRHSSALATDAREEGATRRACHEDFDVFLEASSEPREHRLNKDHFLEDLDFSVSRVLPRFPV